MGPVLTGKYPECIFRHLSKNGLLNEILGRFCCKHSKLIKVNDKINNILLYFSGSSLLNSETIENQHVEDQQQRAGRLIRIIMRQHA